MSQQKKDPARTIGFVGLGVMGEPICRNLAEKCNQPVVAFDTRPEPLQRLAAAKVEPMPSVAAVAAAADVVFLSLPGAEEVRAVCLGPRGILPVARQGQIVVDLSTCPVATAREVAEGLATKGVGFADAPVARTREAAAKGTLSIMVGAAPEIYGRIAPLLGFMATDVTHCGPVGSGQLVKLMNNKILIQTVIAIAEALAIGGRFGIDRQLLLETLAKGSADSFALRNHGMKAMLPGVFPENAFSTRYALKDLGYALQVAETCGVPVESARLAQSLLDRSVEQGNGELYFPAVLKTFERQK